MISIFFALLAYIGWGTGDIFGGLASRKLGGYTAALLTSLVTVFGFSIYLVFNLDSIPAISYANIGLILFLYVIGLVALVSFYEALRIGNAMVVGAIAASFAALTVLFSYLFLGEVVGGLELVAIIIIFSGIILSGCNFKEIFRVKLDKSIVLALVAMVCWGIVFTFLKIPVSEIGWFWPALIGSFTFPVLVVYMMLKNIPFVAPTPRSWIYVILNAAFLTLANFGYNLGIESGRVAIVAPIAGSYSTLFVVLAYFVFKDRMNRQQVVGVITALVGIVALSFLSV